MARLSKILRRIEIIVFPVFIAVILIVLFLSAIYWVNPIQEFFIRRLIALFDLPFEIDYDRLRVGMDFLEVDNLYLKITTDGTEIVVRADSVRTNFNLPAREVPQLDLFHPDVSIISKGGDNESVVSVPDFDIPDFQIYKLTIFDGRFSASEIEIEDIAYRGSMTSAGDGIVLEPDSLGAYLNGRGRIVNATGKVILERGIGVDMDIRLARSMVSGTGEITQIDPIAWRFEVAGNSVDLVEIDSVLGLGFLEGHGDIEIDLEGRGEEVSGDVFIDGEVFTIPAGNASGHLDFRDNRLVITDLKGSAWGATMDVRLQMRFPEEEGAAPIAMEIEGDVENFNLNSFMEPGDELPTDLTGHARVVGQIDDTLVTMTIIGDLGAGSIMNIAFDAASGSLYVSPDSINFYPGFEALRAGNYLTMTGIIVFDKEIYIQFGLWAPNLANLMQIVDMQDIIEGRARIENGEILGDLEHPILSMDLVSDNLTTASVTHDRFLAQMTIYDLIEAPHGDIYIESEGKFGGISYDSLITQVEIHGNRYYVKPFLLWGDSISAKGVAEIVTEPDSVGIRAEGFELEYRGHSVALESTFVVGVKGDKISSSILYARLLGGEIKIDNFVGDKENITLNAWIEGIKIQEVTDYLPVDAVLGELSGEFFVRMPYDISGANGSYHMRLSQFALNDLDFSRAEVEGAIHDGVFEIEPLVIGRETEQYFLRGWVDPATEGIPFNIEMNGRGTRSDVLSSFVQEVDSIVGPFEMTMSASGSADSLYADGRVSWNNGVIGLQTLADPVESLSLAITLTGDRVIIDTLTGVIGALPIESKSIWSRMVGFFKKDRKRYGRFSVGGGIDITNPGIPKMDLSVTAKGLPLNFPEEGLFLRSDAKLTIKGSESILIEGYIKLEKANIVKLETGGGESGLDSLPVELNVLLDIPGNAWIQTDMLDAEIGGSVNIMTEQSALALYGELEVLHGKAFFLGRTFQIRRGQLYFESIEGVNPRLDIQAVSIAGEVEIILEIGGNLEEPQLNLYAQDRSGNRIQTYSQGDLFSLLALNAEGENIQAGSVVENRVPQVIQGYLSQEVEDVARRTLGVETFEFQPSDEDAFDLSQAQVTIGKYLTDRIYLTYSRSLTFDEPTSNIINLEYGLTDHINLQARRESGLDNRDEYRLELQFKWEY